MKAYIRILRIVMLEQTHATKNYQDDSILQMGNPYITPVYTLLLHSSFHVSIIPIQPLYTIVVSIFFSIPPMFASQACLQTKMQLLLV